MEIISSERRRRRRISITAGEVSEANGTCGLTVIKRCVLEEGEHKSYCSKASLCSPSSRTTFDQPRNRRLRCLRQLNQRLKIFAAFGDACSRSMPTTYKQRFKMRKRIVPIVSIVFKTTTSKDFDCRKKQPQARNRYIALKTKKTSSKRAYKPSVVVSPL